MTPPGTELITFWLVGQCRNQPRYRPFQIDGEGVFFYMCCELEVVIQEKLEK